MLLGEVSAARPGQLDPQDKPDVAADALGAQPGTLTVTTGVRDVTRADLARTYLAPNLTAGTYVFFAVADTGVGMDARTRAKEDR